MLAALLFSSAIALTFDDIPGVALPTRCHEMIWNEKVLSALRAHHAPALGLVVEGNACDDLEPILNAWLDDGHDLGNHTHSHLDLHRTPLAEYEADVIRGESPLREILAKHGRKLRYFRHPQLHTGQTMDVKRQLAAFLRDRRYTVAPVTIDSDEWKFAEAYASALMRGDVALAKKIGDAYVPFMRSVTEFFERRAREVVGRPIPQILLLHMNALNADRLDDLLRMYEQRSDRFITVDEALRDPAYALPDTYLGKRGISWIHRWGLAKGMAMVEEPRAPAWIATSSGSPSPGGMRVPSRSRLPQAARRALRRTW